MSDNHRVYRTIKQAIMLSYPGELKGNTARMLTTLAALVGGIAPGKRCQLPAIARKAPGERPSGSRQPGTKVCLHHIITDIAEAVNHRIQQHYAGEPVV